MTKRCEICNDVFSCKRKTSRFCAKCRKTRHNAYRRKWNKAHPKQRRALGLKWKYGVTEDDYNAMLERQDGKCAICGKDTDLCVDHCHKTKKVRGLLCRNCNLGIGLLEDSEDNLLNAVLYVRDDRY